MPKNYNTTDLDPKTAFERHVFHRDQFAHYLRWDYILKEAKMGDTFVDFGCGQGSLLEVLYRNRFKPGYYLGLDIRKQTMKAAQAKYDVCKFPVAFRAMDLTNENLDLEGLDVDPVFAAAPDHVTCFEVVEHVGKSRVPQFLKNFMSCGDEHSVYYLSTPNYSEQAGAAGNHTYDEGIGEGEQIHEWDHDELNELIRETGFEIIHEHGTFASQRDYKKTLSPEDLAVYNRLKEVMSSTMVSNVMAHLLPDPSQARNSIRVMRRA